MAAATCQAQYYGASATEPAGANAETGIKYSREDTQTGATVVPIPTATGTNFSWLKNIALAVTVAGTTNISNRRLSLASTPATGIQIFFKFSSTYAQPTSANKPTDAGTNGNTPAGFTALSTALQVYDNTSVASSSTGRNGGFAVLVLGVDNTYAGGPGSATSLPNLTLTYDEA